MVKKIFTFVIIAYLAIASIIFAPYYNWRYAKENGFIKWLFLGEIVATVKAFAWPYFIIVSNSTDKIIKQTSSNIFNSDEQAKIQDFLSHTSEKILSEDALNEFRSIMQSVTKRLGRYYSKEEAAYYFIEGAELNNNYRLEFGTIVLASWDRKQYVRTQRFDQLYEKMKKYYPKEITNDLDLLKAASLHQDFIKDADGNRFPFGREQILFVNKRNEILKANTEKLVQIMQEFTQ